MYSTQEGKLVTKCKDKLCIGSFVWWIMAQVVKSHSDTEILFHDSGLRTSKLMLQDQTWTEKQFDVILYPTF